MKTITLKRVSFNDDGSYGVLIYEKIPFLVTLERSWKDNARGISSIPEGTYLVRRVVTPKHGNTWQVMNVPGRDSILMHTGNSEIDTEGCIVVGMQFGKVDATDPDTGKTESQPAVLRSKDAYALFDTFMGTDQEFRLIINWC